MIRVVLIDDDAAARYAKSRTLQRAGMEVVSGAGGEDGLRLAATHPDAVLVLDNHLPDVSGLEVCRRLRAEPSGDGLAVLMISATFLRDEDRVSALEAGADVYLTEPVDPMVLVASVRALDRMRQAERHARASARTLQASFDAMRDGLLLVDETGLVRLANPSAQRLLGVGAPTGRPFAELLRDCAPDADAALVAALAGGEPADLDVSCDGRKLQLACSRVPAEAGRAPSMVCRIVDVTAQRAAEADRAEAVDLHQAAREQAEEANRMKDDFLATLSHELRTPLSSIVGWTRILRERSGADPTIRRGLDVIERNVDVQRRLVEELLDVSRIVSGGLRLREDAVDIGDVTRAAVDAVRPAASRHGVDLQVAARPLTVTGDRERLHQIVSNLLANAVKFTPAGGRVMVRLEEDDRAAVLRVEDTGQGIEPQFLPHVFERFRQADSSSTRTHGGLGLGLSIARALAEMHGGGIEAESAGRNAGATFTLRLPLAGSGTPIRSAERTAAGGELQDVRILVVDDDQDACEMHAVMLSGWGAVVTTAGSAEEALRRHEESSPEVVLADISMPRVDGFALVRALRERGATGPILALTADARPEDRARALEAGFDVYLTKPAAPEEILGHLVALRRGHRS